MRRHDPRRYAVTAVLAAACSSSAEDSDQAATLGAALAPVALLGDGENLYACDQRSTNVVRLSLEDAGATTDVLGTGFHLPFLAADASRIYFVRDQLVAVEKLGSAPFVLSDSTGSIAAAAVSEAAVYWLEPGDRGSTTLKAAPKAGGSSVSLATLQTPGGLLAVVGSNVLVGDTPVVAISLSDPLKANGAPRRLEAGLCEHFVGDAVAAFCVPGTGMIVRIDADGSTTQLARVTLVSAAALDASYLYLATKEEGRGRIVRMPRQAGGAELVVSEPAELLAVDARNLYWSNGQGIRYQPKPK